MNINTLKYMKGFSYGRIGSLDGNNSVPIFPHLLGGTRRQKKQRR